MYGNTPPPRLKHVLAYGVEQWSPDGNWHEDKYDRKRYDSVLTPYDMEDTRSYTQPFKRAIRVGGAAGVMYAQNMVNHVPAAASADLAARLRSWGFTGYRTTDGTGSSGSTRARAKTTPLPSKIRSGSRS